jgi:membrane-bound serine protease (ClpP class)
MKFVSGKMHGTHQSKNRPASGARQFVDFAVILFALFILWRGEAWAQTASTTAPQTAPLAKVVLVRLDDEMINPVTSQFICDAIDQAETQNATVVIQLDTPGGLLQSTREIVKKILSAKTPVVVFVAPHGARAASAGVFITLAAHVAAMAPGTNIGAAHVVDATGRWPARDRLLDAASTASLVTGAKPIIDPRDVMSEKIMNDTLAWGEAIANLRGRNAKWARDAVEQSVSVTAEKALELGVVDLLANDVEDLLRKIDGRPVHLDSTTVTLRTSGALIEQLELSQTQQILNILANPNIALMLLLFGLVLLGYELTHPGLWIPGITGLICLLMAALALKMLPTNYTAILLILLGIVLLLAEIKFTSYGLLTVGGAICLFFGALALFQQPKPFVGVTLGFLIPVLVTVVLLVMLLVYLVTRAHMAAPRVGVESFIGSVAEVIRPLQPHGKVFFNGTYWDAVLQGGGSTSAKQVKIVGVKDMVLIVEPVEEDF